MSSAENIDFSTEFPASLGRNSRTPVITDRMQTYLEARQQEEIRRAKRQNGNKKSLPQALGTDATAPATEPPRVPLTPVTQRLANQSHEYTPSPLGRVTGNPAHGPYAPATPMMPLHFADHQMTPQTQIYANTGLQGDQSGMGSSPSRQIPFILPANPNGTCFSQAAVGLDPELNFEFLTQMANWSPEELQEYFADSSANVGGSQDNISEYQSNAASIAADESLLNQVPLSTLITSTPVVANGILQPRSQARAANQANPADTASSSPISSGGVTMQPRLQSHLVTRTHTVIPSVQNQPADSTPTKSNKRSAPRDDSGDESGGDEASTEESDGKKPKKKKKKTGLRASDLTQARRRIFDIAVQIFCIRLLKEDPWSDASMDTLAVEAWFHALDLLMKTWNYKGSTDPTEGELKLITNRATWIRGRCKTFAREGLERLYGLQNPLLDTAKTNKNRDIIKELTTRRAFIYKDPVQRLGVFQTPLIQEVLNKLWFDDEGQSEGVKYSGLFGDEIPRAIILTIVTAIHCSLDEWCQGSRIMIKFAPDVYKIHAEGHGVQFDEWVRLSTVNGTDACGNYQRQLLVNARAYAGQMATARHPDDENLGEGDFN